MLAVSSFNDYGNRRRRQIDSHPRRRLRGCFHRPLVFVFVLPPADVEFILGVVLCLPEQPDDDGTGEQRDEGQTVAQRGQNPHHPVED